ncbi:hypothetical protein D7241_14980 [Stutzerimonas sp. VN223-3]|uniref:hypothetical protein n=1 Tax=Stutzerimonas sp. VN223-3 TaxID=3384601 RepID=UPI0023523EFC|nr:hypothetical protein [Pseudomonas sp.]
MTRWLRTDEKQEFISSVRMVHQMLTSVRDDLEYWKWVVIALHNAMQGAMVMSLRAGNNLRVMPDALAAKCLKAHEAGKQWPPERLDHFPNLYEKVKNNEIMSFYVHSQALPQDPELDRSIEVLLELRNQFIHFTPQGWSIELSGMPSICTKILEAALFLCWNSGNVIWHSAEQSQQARAEVDIALALSLELSQEYAT